MDQAQFLKNLSLVGAALAMFALFANLGARSGLVLVEARFGLLLHHGPMTSSQASRWPRRAGPRPTTTPTNPHTQLDQQPADDAPRQRLERVLAQLPDVVWADTRISVPGARALTFAPHQAGGPPEAFMVATEFAHLHPAPDHSLHLMLPPEVAVTATGAGWAEQHPLAARGLIPAGAVMVYAPRDDTEADVVAQLGRVSEVMSARA